MVATSVGITASVLSARGLLHEVASKIILAAAVIDDVLGLIVLAIVSSVARGRVNFWEIALIATLATTFTIVMAVWGTTAAKRLLPIFGSRARADNAEFHHCHGFFSLLWRCWLSTPASQLSWGRFWPVWLFQIVLTRACEL